MKTSRAAACLLAALLLTSCGPYDVAAVDEIPEPVRRSVRAAVDGGHRVGVVVAVINPVGRHYLSYGTVSGDDARPLTPASQFGIGSLTKLFTAELLAAAVVDGRVGLDDAVVDGLPAIDDPADTRLWQLATHRAGLPREIPDAALRNDAAAPLLALLAMDRTLPADPHYSNAGMALLGLALEQADETSLDQQIEQRIARPLGLSATGYQPDPARLARPHAGRLDISSGRPETPAVARGAGGLYSSADDLLEFVAAHLAPADGLQAQRVALLTGRADGMQAGIGALGWKLHLDGDLQVFHHGGDGNGYQAFMGFRQDNGVGVVLLSNSSADDALQRIALHLLDPRIDLPRFDHPPAIALDTRKLRRHVGHYRIDHDDGNTIELTLDDEGLVYVERTGAGKQVRRSRLHADSATRMHLREVPVTLEFPTEDAPTRRIVLRFQDQRFTLLRER